MKKKIGILSYSLTNHKTMLDLAKKLSKKNKINFFYASDLNINYNIKNVEFIKLYIKEKKEKDLLFENNTNKNNFKILIKKNNFLNKFINIKNYLSVLFSVIIKYIYTYVKFKKYSTNLLFVPGDRENIFELCIIKFVLNKQGKIFIYPSALAASPDLLVFWRKKHITDDKKFIKKFPLQIFNYKNKNYSFFGKNYTKIYKLFKILPKNPWTLASSENKFLILNNNISANYYTDLGTHKKNILYYKSVEYEEVDEIYKNYKFNKKNFYRKLNLTKNRKNLFINLPNWNEHKMLTKENETKYFTDLFDKLKKIKVHQKFNLIVGLHPRQKKNDYLYLQKKYKVKIIAKKALKIFPFMDCFLAYGGTSIIIDSINLKIPVLFFDNFKGIRKFAIKFKKKNNLLLKIDKLDQINLKNINKLIRRNKNQINLNDNFPTRNIEYILDDSNL